MEQSTVYHATQVFQVLSDYGGEKRIDDLTYQITGLAYETIAVGETLYLDIDQAPISLLKIEIYGHSFDEIDRGLTGMITVELTLEAAARYVMKHPKHLYRLNDHNLEAAQQIGYQKAFIPPHLL